MARKIAGYDYHSVGIKNQEGISKAELKKTNYLFRLLFLLAFIAILSIFYIWSRVQIVEYGYDITRLKKEQINLLEEKRKLMVEVSVLKSPQYLQEVADKKTKLKEIKLDQLIY